jgi:cell division protein FtsB
MNYFELLKSKFATVLLLVVFSVVTLITTQLYLQKKQVNSAVAMLQKQSDELTRDNQQLSELIKYLDTTEFREKEAREKLNLKKPGEEVVVLNSSDAEGLVSGANESTDPNPKKWFNYFFSK